ncbi:hypothetical protein HMPREF9162_2207 [Selenomonas sp. oral taxon 137 str. F0430]|nr:hypothetical protein HMPREF9162_2207 [Selenomonas sp. oral taxon 137 str. F0430]
MFQSTRPVRGATRAVLTDAFASKVSIHAPRAGRDYAVVAAVNHFAGFNPRAPCGARLA